MALKDRMTYAKAFMKKVLESDLTDTDSFANKLTDSRYKTFAASFNSSVATKVAQTGSQEDATTGLYSNSLTQEDSQVVERYGLLRHPDGQGHNR